MSLAYFGYLYDAKLLPADVIYSRGEQILSKAIRELTQYGGERETYTDHVILTSKYIGSGIDKDFIEAQLTTRYTGINELKDERKAFQVWRYVPLHLEERIRIAEAAEPYINKWYGLWKLPILGVEGILGKLLFRNVTFIRKVLFKVDPNNPICNYIVGYAYSTFKIMFGVSDVEHTTPDDQLDWIEAHPYKSAHRPGWVKILEVKDKKQIYLNREV